MVDYSKFNSIEASDSEDEKQTVDPDKAEAWLRKYDELAKDQSSDSDSDSDAEPTIAGVDWAKEGATRLGPDKYDAALQARCEAQEPDPGRRDVADAHRKKAPHAPRVAGPDGRVIRGRAATLDLKDAEAVPAAILHLKGPVAVRRRGAAVCPRPGSQEARRDVLRAATGGPRVAHALEAGPRAVLRLPSDRCDGPDEPPGLRKSY